MPFLSKHILPPVIEGVPAATLLGLPEKVIQFGTGVLLRALPDYFIDRANKQGIFQGRVILVKSTDIGELTAYAHQDGLYTHIIRGWADGMGQERIMINTSVSRVLSASRQWPDVLSCAGLPGLQLVISNTTEVGLHYVPESIVSGVPVSFPGKLLAFLFQRYTCFGGDRSRGLVIIPTELIPDNGLLLRQLLGDLARYNRLPQAFMDWLFHANSFCSSLVDRIVPGKLPPGDQELMEQRLGYRDPLMITSESYGLWAIETGDPKVQEVLSFAAADPGVVVAPDIQRYRELKLRLLNAPHTFSCGLAFLAGFDTVREAMAHPHFERYVQALMLEDIAPCLYSNTISKEAARSFALQTLDRFRNPYLEHRWLNITLQYTSKMKMRNVPLLQRAGQCFPEIPERMCLGFAAFLLFMRGHARSGTPPHITYTVQDDFAGYFAEKWEQLSGNDFVEVVMRDISLWGMDLSLLPGFLPGVTIKLQELQSAGALAALAHVAID